MKKFVLYILLLAIGTLFGLEIALRQMKVAGKPMPNTNIEGDMLLIPNSDGFWVRGGVGEIKSHYHVNAQGWNSVLDYEAPYNVPKIALVGDSYIQGLHGDVENSVGRIVERQLDSQVVVFEFGRDGANLLDYLEIYKTRDLGQFAKCYILVHNSDLLAKKAEVIGRGKKKGNGGFIRRIYEWSHVVRYLNINHGLSSKLKGVIHRFSHLLPEKKEGVNKVDFTEKQKNQIKETLSQFGENVIFLYEIEKLDIDLFKEAGVNTLEIQHKIQPYDCGFDMHWNDNGRLNCATTISLSY